MSSTSYPSHSSCFPCLVYLHFCFSVHPFPILMYPKLFLYSFFSNPVLISTSIVYFYCLPILICRLILSFYYFIFISPILFFNCLPVTLHVFLPRTLLPPIAWTPLSPVFFPPPLTFEILHLILVSLLLIASSDPTCSIIIIHLNSNICCKKPLFHSSNHSDAFASIFRVCNVISSGPQILPICFVKTNVNNFTSQDIR